MRIVEIPILGPPLAGKTTILHRARDAFGGQLRSLEPGETCRLAALHIQTEAVHGHIWCAARGASPESVLPLVPSGSPAVLVFDGEGEEWLDGHAPHIDLSRSVVIVTKADATVPAALRERPSLHIDAHDPQCVPHVHRFLSEHFDLFERPPGARPLQERAALMAI